MYTLRNSSRGSPWTPKNPKPRLLTERSSPPADTKSDKEFIYRHQQTLFFQQEENATKTHKKTLIVFSIAILFATLSGLLSPVHAPSLLIWQGSVSSSGAPVVGPVLALGVNYSIVAYNRWWYSYADNLAADAEYYTTDFSDSWEWTNHFRVDDHSFLQIDGQDVEWGPFSNGDTNHTYTVQYVGQGTTITFAIVDWVDGNYANNECHLNITICEETSTTCVGGYIVDPGTSFGGGLLFATVGISALAVPAITLVVKRRAKARCVKSTL